MRTTLLLDDLQLLLCGKAAVDVDDWEANCEYRGGLDAESTVVRWFWNTVRGGFSEGERVSLLRFSTGSGRIPATGFKNLMGYGGQQQCFTLERAVDHSGGSGGVNALSGLPTASTCFNTLKLPEAAVDGGSCGSEEELRRRLLTAMRESRGFEEDAV
jgi:hypothetical protein